MPIIHNSEQAVIWTNAGAVIFRKYMVMLWIPVYISESWFGGMCFLSFGGVIIFHRLYFEINELRNKLFA